MSVRIDIEANISNLTAALDKVHSRLGELDKKVNESKGKVGKLFDSQDSNKLLKSIGSMNTELDRQRKALSDLEKYQIYLYAAQKKTNDPAGIQKFNAELARTKVAIKELTDKSKGSIKLIDDLRQIPVAGNSAVGTIQSLGIAIASVVSLRGLSQLAAQAVQVASSFENTRVSFEVMLGSGQKATELLGQLVREAAVTPFELGQLTEISQRLLAMGITAEELIPTIRVLGDIGAGVGVEKLPQLTLALGQVRTAGRLMGTELRQFTEAGVPLLEALATKGGKSVKQISADMSAGKIGFNQVQAALAGLTEQGGKFFGLMNKQSQTLTGLTSTLKDDFKTLLRSVGEGISEGLKDSARAADGFVKSFDPEKLREFGKAIGSAISFLAKFVGLIIPLGAGVAAATTGVTLLTGAARLLGITLAGTAGPVGIAIFALTSLVTLAAQYSLRVDALSDSEKKLKGLRESSIELVRTEKRNSDALFETIKSVNSSKEQKAKATQKLLDLYPQYLGDINTNKELLNNLDEAQRRVTAGLIDYITKQQEAKALEGELAQYYTDQKNLQEAKIKLRDAELKSFQKLTNAEVLGGQKADQAVVEATKNVENAGKKAEATRDNIRLIAEGSQALRQAVTNGLEGIDLTPEITALQASIGTIQKDINAAEASLKYGSEKSKNAIKVELEALKRQLAGEKKALDSLFNTATKDKPSGDTGTDNGVKAAEKRAKELADAEKRIRDLRIQFIINERDREIALQGVKYDDLLNQLEEFHKKKLISLATFNELSQKAELQNKIALIDINAKFDLIESNAKNGKDKVKQLQAEIDIERQAFRDKVSLVGLTNRDIEYLTTEHNKKQLILISQFVAEADKRDEEASKKRLDRLKLINELTSNERARELLELEESFKSQTKVIGGSFDGEEGAKIYEKARLDYSNRKMEINKKYDAIDLENELKSLSEQQDYRLKVYKEQYEQQSIAIDQLNVDEEKKNLLRFELDRKRKIFELELERDFLFAKLNAGTALSDNEKKLIAERIKTLVAGISQLENAVKPTGAKKFDFWKDVFGLDGENEKDAKIISGIQTVYDEATKLADEYLAGEVQRTAEASRLADQRVSDLQGRLDKELDLKNQGYANNYALVQKELEDAKSAQAKALDDRKKAAKAQLALQTVEQSVNLITASAKIFNSVSAIPFVGPAIAIGLIGAMIAGFVASKKKAFAAINAGQFEHGGDVDASTGVLRGKRHKDGGIKFQYEAEEGEFATSDGRRLNIVNRKMTAKHFNLLNAINKDDRGGMVKSLFELTGGMRMIDIDRTIPSSSKQVIVNNQTLSVTELREIRDILKENGRGMQISDGDKVRVERSGNYTRVINK